MSKLEWVMSGRRWCAQGMWMEYVIKRNEDRWGLYVEGDLHGEYRSTTKAKEAANTHEDYSYEAAMDYGYSLLTK